MRLASKCHQRLRGCHEMRRTYFSRFIFFCKWFEDGVITAKQWQGHLRGWFFLSWASQNKRRGGSGDLSLMNLRGRGMELRRTARINVSLPGQPNGFPWARIIFYFCIQVRGVTFALRFMSTTCRTCTQNCNKVRRTKHFFQIMV